MSSLHPIQLFGKIMMCQFFDYTNRTRVIQAAVDYSGCRSQLALTAPTIQCETRMYNPAQAQDDGQQEDHIHAMP